MNNINDIPEEIKQKAIEKGLKDYKGSFINIYAIKDKKIGFIEIMTGKTDGLMIRNLQGAARSKQTQVGQFPEDFELYALGKMDETNGTLYSETRYITSAKDLIENEK